MTNSFLAPISIFYLSLWCITYHHFIHMNKTSLDYYSFSICSEEKNYFKHTLSSKRIYGPDDLPSKKAVDGSFRFIPKQVPCEIILILRENTYSWYFLINCEEAFEKFFKHILIRFYLKLLYHINRSLKTFYYDESTLLISTWCQHQQNLLLKLRFWVINLAISQISYLKHLKWSKDE